MDVTKLLVHNLDSCETIDAVQSISISYSRGATIYPSFRMEREVDGYRVSYLGAVTRLDGDNDIIYVRSVVEVARWKG